MPKQLGASLAFINIPSDDPASSREFYEKLFGVELARSMSEEESYHAPISEDGIDLNVTRRHTPQEAVTAFLAVEDLEKALRTARNAGAKVVWGPEALQIPADDFKSYKANLGELEGTDVKENSMGIAAILIDPGGSQVGLVQLADHAHKHFAVGKFQRPLTDHQVKVQEKAMQLTRNRDPRAAR